MTQYSKFNIVYRLQKWMDSVPGQTFLNYAYSWGASIVILGTLFKLTHLPGANFFLFLGMGTEVFVFFISAFDRPFDKTADGMDLPTHVGEEYEKLETVAGETEQIESSVGPVVSGGNLQGGTIIINGSGSGTHTGSGVAAAVASPAPAASGAAEAPVVEGAAAYVAPPLTPDMTDATNAYVEELKKLTEVLEKVADQSRRLTTDSEEMENLNRTLTGICKVYELQLRSASSQISTIDEINEQTKKMAQQIDQLNKIYARMIDAMTVNMRVAAPGTGM
ncbi:MAG: gliding motility protein GldL [Prevotella sp.]|nr:gliding motility protein GldL [Prevotella sp.]MBQ6659136.1 gliding motility protein GldL [Prevotella sp.]MBR0524399.1 gliding motility protein GldL [Prevotella sp.]